MTAPTIRAAAEPLDISTTQTGAAPTNAAGDAAVSGGAGTPAAVGVTGSGPTVNPQQSGGQQAARRGHRAPDAARGVRAGGGHQGNTRALQSVCRAAGTGGRRQA